MTAFRFRPDSVRPVGGGARMDPSVLSSPDESCGFAYMAPFGHDSLEVVILSRQEEKVVQMRRSERLTQQDWHDWLRMAEGTLAGCSQMVWQDQNVRNENRDLFAKVAKKENMTEDKWKNAITWAGAILLSLSAEQSMKALAIRKSNGECRKTHDLKLLWDALCTEDKNGIEQSAQELAEHVENTNLAKGKLMNIKEIEGTIEHHRSTFEHARYYKEEQSNNQQIDLTKNVELWNFSLAVFMYAESL